MDSIMRFFVCVFAMVLKRLQGPSLQIVISVNSYRY